MDMTENRTELNGAWKLSWVENEKFIKDNLKLNSIKAIESADYSTVPASVPGNFELDLFKAGLIPDPYFGKNTLELQKFESVHMFYYRRFNFDGDSADVELVFEGIDTIADVYINGNYQAAVDNMLVEHVIKCDHLKKGENEMVVHIKPAVIESRKRAVPASSRALKYNSDSLWLRKAPHMFGWDIFPRIISGGIWRDVYLKEVSADRINDVFVMTSSINLEAKTAKVEFAFDIAVSKDSLADYSLKVEGKCGESCFSHSERLWHTSGNLGTEVENAAFWFPKNYGDPNLYDVTISLLYQNNVVDERKLRHGIRTVELLRTSVTDEEGNGEFCFIINGKRVFVLGTNWVGADAFHSRDLARMPEILPMLNDLNCNMVRCWGGNVYEHDYFYNFCDKNGIMVWQDFAMACAIMPQEQDFYDMLTPEIEKVTKRLRNHCSIVLWAGDNECDQVYIWGWSKRNPNDNYVNRRLIPSILKNHDISRPYLPSSPYIDEVAYDSGKPLPEDHLWGPRDYFKGDYYRNNHCHFASETGYHGCNSVESLKKFISPKKLWPYLDNDEWQIHGSSPEAGCGPYTYRIELMANQIKAIFTKIPDNIEDFSLASQISQAEAKKFFIERFRITKDRRTGILWWNLVDGWPQISDAVVDYYLEKKLAYHYIKRSQQPLCMMFDEPENGKINLYVVNELMEAAEVSYKVTNLTENTLVAEGSFKAVGDCSQLVYSHNISESDQNFYLIEWEQAGVMMKNHYMSGMKNINLESYVKYAKKAGFEMQEIN